MYDGTGHTLMQSDKGYIEKASTNWDGEDVRKNSLLSI